MWESKYKPATTISRTKIPVLSTSSTPDLVPSKPPSKPKSQFADFLHKQKAKALAQLNDTTSSDDEYTRYIKEKVEWVDDLIAWWLQPVQRHKYPNLSKMAINMLSIPCMSADVERLFSSCGLTITDRRNRIRIELLEALECLKSWFKIKEFDILESVVRPIGESSGRSDSEV